MTNSINNKLSSDSALAISEYLINMQRYYPVLNLSHLKLQKLLFYCQAFHIASKDVPMYKEDVLAWTYGPVVNEVYKKYKSYGGQAIVAIAETDQEEGDDNKYGIPAESLSTISSILDAFGHLSAIALMEKTHRETPWIEAYKKGHGSVITHEAMKNYYRELLVD